jgi:putative DNA methylase
MRAIERDCFPFEFISQLAERESWRKEIHRPIYHVHKWWAKRLGSVFRGVLLGAALKEETVDTSFYRAHSFDDLVVFDPFMGSGTTIGEAHKLGFVALGRDINPVATTSVKAALGPMGKSALQKALVEILETAGEQIQRLYRTKDSRGRECDVLYYFWVMQADCPACHAAVDLFPSYVVASNAYPKRKPEVQLCCPSCGDIFCAASRDRIADCPACATNFDPNKAVAKGAKAQCQSCRHEFVVLEALNGCRPNFRLYAKLVLTDRGSKEYLRTTEEDAVSYSQCSALLAKEIQAKKIWLPELALENGHNTRQAISYGFRAWRDFFNDRQLMALATLRSAISKIEDESTQHALSVLFSGVLEFNNLFTSYKGEGTGAVRHMFAHHILKPERVPIEANIWGTSKSSGSFTGLFKSRLLRAIEYRLAPTEVGVSGQPGVVAARPFSGRIETDWPTNGIYVPRGIYISCGDSAKSALAARSVDLVVTDPPFFDNVHYSELADFFYAWHPSSGTGKSSTRNVAEVQDTDSDSFAEKLQSVFQECHRVLKDDGLLVFTYHHSRAEGWHSLARAVMRAGFFVVNSHPVKSEMSVATPKVQAKEPIQLDIILVCRKASHLEVRPPSRETALKASRAKLHRMEKAGFQLSRNDRKVTLFGQLLTILRAEHEIAELESVVIDEDNGLELGKTPADVTA